MAAPDSVRTYFNAGDTATLTRVSQAYEHLTGGRGLAGVPEASLFALLVELRHIHSSQGAAGDHRRAQELLQDFLSHTKAKQEVPR
ncbi:hypothetical protein K4A83_11105 [Spirulina subsalsa FACHB-351]|uniref:Cell division protein ZapE n=1 Tax=Spirulina subsalsa FACHB-351 TaxID=234711 RepID=A0ABT3L768_9CYAN|nr:hypothetical protein [Spirulina subsalsa]MCW6036805.1 hypothetical protein [Spirulina subsalsa FACHB-351]